MSTLELIEILSWPKARTKLRKSPKNLLISFRKNLNNTTKSELLLDKSNAKKKKCGTFYCICYY